MEHPLVPHVFGNHVILKNILTRLPSQDGFSCRLVSQSWSDWAGEYLKTLTIFKVAILNCREIEVTQIKWTGSTAGQQNFSCESEDISSRLPGRKEAEEIAASASCFQTLAKTLNGVTNKEIWLYIHSPFQDYGVAHPELRKFLEGHRSWITRLFVSESIIQQPLFIPPLPQLTVLKIKSYSFFTEASVGQLLNLFPNVREILGFPLFALPLLQQDPDSDFVRRFLPKIRSVEAKGKQGFVKWRLDQHSTLTPMSMNGVMNFEVLHLTFDLYSGDLLRACDSMYTDIFRGCAHTLKRIVLPPFPPTWHDMKIPPLPGLTTLALKLTEPVCEGASFFTTGLDIPSTFPNLRRIELQIFDSRWGATAVLLPPDYDYSLLEEGQFQFSIPQIMELELHYATSNPRPLDEGLKFQDLSRLTRIFPEVRRLEVTGVNSKWMEEELLRLWDLNNWREKIQELEIVGRMVCYREPNCLDPVFTGIQIYDGQCDLLYKNVPNNADTDSKSVEDVIKTCRIHHGISTMTALQRLDLTFTGLQKPNGRELKDGTPRRPLSPVAHHHGFEKVAGLQVHINIPVGCRERKRIAEGLAPILPFVKFQPNYYLRSSKLQK